MANYDHLLILRCMQAFHPGTGTGMGVIDNPIQRSVTTTLPIFWDSGLKGSLKERTRNEIDGTITSAEHAMLFGSDVGADGSPASGLFTEAHVLIFPVRSARGVFTWITCPYVLNRFFSVFANPDVKVPSAFQDPTETFSAFFAYSNSTMIPTVAKKCSDGVLRAGIEEFILTFEQSEQYAGLSTILAEIVYPGEQNAYWKKHLINNLLVVSNDLFKHLAFFDTEVRTRNRIGALGVTEGTGLFVSEYLPEQTVLYASSSIFDVNQEHKNRLSTIVKNERTLFAGGNITIGKGMLNLHVL